MKKWWCILALLACATAVQARVFVVYQLTAAYSKIGPAYAAGDNAAGFQGQASYRGVFLYDAETGQSTVVWGAKVGRDKMLWMREFGTKLLNYRARGKNLHDVYAMNTPADLNADLTIDELRTIMLVGRKAMRVNIGGTGVGNWKTMATSLNGNEWVTKIDGVSVANGQWTLRYDKKGTTYANTTLAADLTFDFDKLVGYYVHYYTNRGYSFRGPFED